LIAALLDTLKIDKVVVHAFSAGGLVGYTFAARYPDRCHVLLALACHSGSDDGKVSDAEFEKEASMYSSVFINRHMDFFCNWFPHRACKMIVGAVTKISPEDNEKLATELIKNSSIKRAI